MTWLSTETVAPGGLVRTIIRRRTQPQLMTNKNIAKNNAKRKGTDEGFKAKPRGQESNQVSKTDS